MNYFNQIKNIAIADGMPSQLAYLIAAQAVHETGNFTSKLFKENNNAFGYKYVKGAMWQEGPGRMSPEKNVYARYASVTNSVHEVTAWIRRRLKEGLFPPLKEITTPNQYASALKKSGYYGDTIKNYVAGIESALQKYSVV